MEAQILACDPLRLLSESDHNTCTQLAPRTLEVVTYLATVLGEDPATYGSQLAASFFKFRAARC